jgi:hypothetical protein
LTHSSARASPPRAGTRPAGSVLISAAGGESLKIDDAWETGLRASSSLTEDLELKSERVRHQIEALGGRVLLQSPADGRCACGRALVCKIRERQMSQAIGVAVLAPYPIFREAVVQSMTRCEDLMRVAEAATIAEGRAAVREAARHAD